jgi:hypothetical protein
MEFSASAARRGEAKVPTTRHRAKAIDDARAERVANMTTVWLHSSADATLTSRQSNFGDIPGSPLLIAR